MGRRVGALLRAGDAVALIGPMGSGKTVLARGIALGAGASGYIASPSFVVIREYQGPVPVFHADLYRLERRDEINDLGLDELIDDGAGIMVIEWADRAPWILPADHLRVACASRPEPSTRVFTLTIPASMSRLAEALVE